MALNRFAFSLKKTRDAISSHLSGLGRMFGAGKRLDTQVAEELEEALILADVGPRAASEIVAELVKDSSGLPPHKALVRIISERFRFELGRKEEKPNKPQVVLVVGVNGSGKTTTIGKIAARVISRGGTVVMAAADTFRAAAAEQLEIWARKLGADLISQKQGADPAAVAFDAVKAGMARNADMVLVDTAGRLQTKTNLMEELRKIKKVIGKALPSAPHETLIVMDATSGQNGLSQIQLFHTAIGLTGIVVAKLDGTAKGGVLVAAASRFKIPIKYVGVGERESDLLDFDPTAFAEALVRIDGQPCES